MEPYAPGSLVQGSVHALNYPVLLWRTWNRLLHLDFIGGAEFLELGAVILASIVRSYALLSSD